MNSIIWHIDSALLTMVHRPLVVLGISFVVLLCAITLCVIKTNGDSNDS